jgi:hypothetical protein
MDNKELRGVTNMSAFTFYLDDFTKLGVLEKLRAMGLDTKKGALSATIRVLLNEFAKSDIDMSVKAEIESEYLFTTKKNKRSTL